MDMEDGPESSVFIEEGQEELHILCEEQRDFFPVDGIVCRRSDKSSKGSNSHPKLSIDGDPESEAWIGVFFEIKQREILTHVAVYHLNGDIIASDGPCIVRPVDVRAIVSQIRHPGPGLVQINLDQLRFLCMGSSVDILIGISNFNSLDDATVIDKTAKRLTRITSRQYSQQFLLDPRLHALQLAAIILDDRLLLLGVAMIGQNSLIEELNIAKDIMKSKERE